MTEDQYTEEADVSHLEQRIDELEETIRQMLPSRREALGMGVAGLAGASLMSGTASAGSAQVGTIGDASNLVDLVAEDVTITDTLNTASISGAAADEALLSDGSGNLTFGSVGGVEEVSTFGNLPTIDPPQLAYVTGQQEYYHSRPITGTPFDITSSLFGLDTTISTQGGLPRGLAISNPGTRLYAVDSGNDNINEYILSTPDDISTASFNVSINTQDSDSNGIDISADGSALFEIGLNSDLIYQYTMSTPFDLSTASFQTSISTQDTIPQGIRLAPDGTKLYETGNDQDKIYQSDLSTPFDITSSTFDTSISAQDATPTGIDFSNDGTRMIEVGSGTNPGKIHQYTLSNPFDISTATFQNSKNFSGGLQDACFNSSGSKLYEIELFNDEINQYTISEGGWEAF